VNERIRELLKQAGGIQHDEDGDELTAILVGKDLAKFAELVVRECARVGGDIVLNQNEDNDMGVFLGIKKHFGVEE
jgi:hypothetical protein